MADETQTTGHVEQAADPQVLEFVKGIRGDSKGLFEQVAEAADEAGPEAIGEAPPEQPKGKDEPVEAKPEVEGEKPKRGEPDPVKAEQAFKERQAKRNARRDEILEMERKLQEKEDTLNAVLQAVQRGAQQQAPQHVQEQYEQPQIPAFEEDEAGNLDARLRRLEQWENHLHQQQVAMQRWEAEQQYKQQVYQHQSSQVQNFVQQFAEDEQEWVKDSPQYLEKSRILYEGTVNEIMEVQGVNKSQAEEMARRSILGVAANSYQRGEPPFKIFEKLAERYMGVTSAQVTQAKKPKETNTRFASERAAIEDGAAGSLSSGRAASGGKVPMSVQQFKEGNLSSKEISNVVGNVMKNRGGRDNLFQMLRELEG